MGKQKKYKWNKRRRSGLEREQEKAGWGGRKRKRKNDRLLSFDAFFVIIVDIIIIVINQSHPQAPESGLAVSPRGQQELGQEAHAGAHERRGHAGGDVDVGAAGHFRRFGLQLRSKLFFSLRKF